MAEVITIAPRIATAADTDRLVQLINAAFRVEDFFIHGDRTHADEIAGMIATPGTVFLVVDNGHDELLGAVRVVVDGAHAHFGMLATHPLQQGRGVGRLLLGAVERYAAEQRCTEVGLEIVNLRTELQPYYERAGYVVCGREPFPVPLKLRRDADLIVMSKQLTR